MINTPAIAEFVNDLVLDINGRLNESIEEVERNCPPEESSAYKRKVGKIIDAMFEVILEPIYVKHPSLKPPGLE